MASDFKSWKKEMKDWLKDLIKWQEAHPDKNWLDELCDGTDAEALDDEGGDRPPTPPKNP